MIRSISGVARKILAANKMSFLSTIISIAISVALIVSMFSLAHNAENTAKDEFTKLYGTVDIFAGYDRSQPFQNKDIIDQIDGLSSIQETGTFIVGHLFVDQGNDATYSVGVDNSELSKSRYKYEEDIEKGEVALNEGLLEALHKTIGDKIIIEQREFVISESFQDLSNRYADMPDMILTAIEIF